MVLRGLKNSIPMAISTFSPIGSLSSNGLRMRVCVCVLVYSTGIVWNELICGYASTVNTSGSFHTHTHMHAHTHTHTYVRTHTLTSTHIHHLWTANQWG